MAIPYFEGKWLFTRHLKRGIEFPGGKREENESCKEALLRETMEEAGAVISTPLFIADYRVYQPGRIFTKRVFFTEIIKITPQNEYFETNGPILLAGDLATLVKSEKFSYFMRDEGMEKIIANCKKKIAISAMIKKDGG